MKRRDATATRAEFEELYRTHRGEVYRFALRSLGNREDAEDATQSAFVNAYTALARGGSPERPRAWLFTIADNVFRRRFRRKRVVEVPVEEIPDAAAADTDAITSNDVRTALARLPFNQRAALVLREVAGFSYGEIARQLGVSAGAVQMLLFRARQTLRAELEGARNLGAKLRQLVPLPIPAWLGGGGAPASLGPVARAAAAAAAALAGAAVIATVPSAGTAGSEAELAPVVTERDAPAPATSRPPKPEVRSGDVPRRRVADEAEQRDLRPRLAVREDHDEPAPPARREEPAAAPRPPAQPDGSAPLPLPLSPLTDQLVPEGLPVPQELPELPELPALPVSPLPSVPEPPLP